MKHKKLLTVLITTGIILLSAGKLSIPADAAATFDPAYYAATYPDVTKALGTDPQTLLAHYLTSGMAEGRVPFKGAAPGTPVDGGNTNATAASASQTFDPAYYAATYPDVAKAIGANPQTLLTHYLTFGMAEGRVPFKGAAPGAPVNGMNANAVSAPAQTAGVPVPINKLANLKSIKKSQTNAQFTEAYNAALQIVTPLIGLPIEEQLMGIAEAVRAHYDTSMVYSHSTPHYNDPYGYFILNMASCAGCARATGLCLNILGIPYEHVHENQWCHQWCRVNVNGTYWICDAYGLYCGPEPAPYTHPWLD